jgi:hypothetical protein
MSSDAACCGGRWDSGGGSGGGDDCTLGVCSTFQNVLPVPLNVPWNIHMADKIVGTLELDNENMKMLM